MPGTISDPRMNPSGERAFGFVAKDEDGHQYTYLKTLGDESTLGSRFFTAGTKVNLGKVYPVYIVIPDLSAEEIDEYQEMNFNDNTPLKNKLAQGAMELNSCISECKNGSIPLSLAFDWKQEPVVYDFIEVPDMSKSPKQDVLTRINEFLKSILK